MPDLDLTTLNFTTLQSLDRLYPGERWWFKAEDGSFCGPCTTPEDALARVHIEWGDVLFREAIEDGNPTVGMWVEDATFLVMTHQLVQAGLAAELATKLADQVSDLLSRSVRDATDEEAFYGWQPLYDVSEDGELTPVV